jgi:hypothetical protein
MENRKCIDCKESKLKCDFYVKNIKSGALQSYCKMCSNIRRRKRDQIFRSKNLHKRTPNKIECLTTCSCCGKRKITTENFRIQTNGINYEKVCKSCKNVKLKERLLLDPIFKLKKEIRSVIRDGIKRNGYTKKSKTYDILGIEYEGFKIYFESLFSVGMSWNNHGEWHYDHIIPLSTSTTYDEVIKLNHYTNLQPLWAEDNLKKGSKIL